MKKYCVALWAVCVLFSLTGMAGEQLSTKPEKKDFGRHEGFVKIAKQGGVDLLFLGDSITDGWRGGGKAVWDKNFLPLKAANFGISGDKTEHVLWRLQNGELEGIQPKLAVIMIGTNNVGRDSAGDIADGVKAIVKELQTKTPQTKILLLAIFPRSPKPDKTRAKLQETNEIIAKLDDGKNLKYLDIGDKFMDADKNIPKDIMPDALHPNAKGYEIWADAIIGPVKEMMGEK